MKSRLLLGFVLPLIVEIIGSYLIARTDSGAEGASFAYLVVLIMLLAAMPITIAVNSYVVPAEPRDSATIIVRGMIFPAFYIAAVLIYYTGLWDQLVSPMFS